MAKARFSRRAETDLLNIGAYTLQTWGAEQAIKYLANLEACCLMLANNPGLGRNCDDIRPGLVQMETGGHVVFYRKAARGILISRILHRSMLPIRHGLKDEGDLR